MTTVLYMHVGELRGGTKHVGQHPITGSQGGSFQPAWLGKLEGFFGRRDRLLQGNSFRMGQLIDFRLVLSS